MRRHVPGGRRRRLAFAPARVVLWLRMPQVLDTSEHPEGDEPLVAFEHIRIGHGTVPGYVYIRFPEYVIAVLDRGMVEQIVQAMRAELAFMEEQEKNAGHS
ncbi:MAG: hypothetical protein KDJ88_06145 [Bauldia sp.]|nr:hypothetical protein [Bauldia sp.]